MRQSNPTRRLAAGAGPTRWLLLPRGFTEECLMAPLSPFLSSQERKLAHPGNFVKKFVETPEGLPDPLPVYSVWDGSYT